MLRPILALVCQAQQLFDSLFNGLQMKASQSRDIQVL